jgi:hypothetical protein
MTALRSRAQSLRLGAVLVFIGLPALLLALAVLNVLQIASDRMTVEETTRQATALERRLAAARPGAGEPTASLSLRAASRTAAIADLQQALINAVAAASGRVIETSGLEGEGGTEEASDRIDVKTVLDIDNDGLLSLLTRLESGLPLMTVESLSIRRLPGTQATPSGDGESMDAERIMLRVDLAISARWTSANEAGS